MRQHLKSILLAQAIIALATTAIFANINNKSAIFHPVKANAPDKEKKNMWLAEHLVSFNAEFSSRTVSLHWNLAGTRVGGHFNIERSIDGENFEKVGEVSANDIPARSYSFDDNIKASVARKNDLYYRLQQVERDNISYSKVLIVRMYETHSVASISVTPDPAINDIQVNVQLKENSFVVMKINDNSGNEVMKKTAKAGEGNNIFSLAGTSKLRPGNYKLEIIVNSNERMVMQLIKS
ncbi:MAG: T9SS type A sorting domain-containing protein [Bacteroidetes bacterium]|nr:T9SS type A sorting domain-containing protein [Bacteroidota bacterium]MBS1973299.1 T9SS type A sorting domain-containing protein [Bacteroidota bacterium]